MREQNSSIHSVKNSTDSMKKSLVSRKKLELNLRDLEDAIIKLEAPVFYLRERHLRRTQNILKRLALFSYDEMVVAQLF